MGRIAKAKKTTRSPLAVHIGQRLLALRQDQQLTMRAVAERTGLSNAFVCQIENGQSCPTADTLWRLSQCFAVLPGYFFEGFQCE